MLRKSVLALWVLLFVGSLSVPSMASAQAAFTCADFNTQEAAQAVLDANLDDDTNRALDPDGDGLACEDLPSSGNGNQVEPTEEPEPTTVPEEPEATTEPQEPEETAVPDQPAKRPLEGRFGGSRETFEEQYGDPVDAGQGNYPIGNYYEVAGFESVNAFFHRDYVAYLTLTAADAPWSKIKANQLVKGFLPADVELDRAVNTDDGDVLTTGHSKALEKRFGKGTYEDYGAKGEKGDLYFVLRLNDDSKVEVIEIALGHELQTGEPPDTIPTPTVASSSYTPEQIEYLQTIRPQFDALKDSLDGFDKALDDFGDGTITAEQLGTQLAAIFSLWREADTTARAITPPADMEETHELFLEFTGLLAGAAEDYTNGLTNNDQAALEAGDEKVAQASFYRELLDALLSIPEE